MPEGPSIVILRQQAEPFIGKKAIAVSGNSKEDIQRLKDKEIMAFKTWGKHFLICYEGFTVRIHLMLFGSYRINEGKNTVPRLSLKFDNGFINFYSCSIKFIEEDLDAIYDWSADIMSNLWNEENAKVKLLAKPYALLCDVLLDQQIFAGSGNIIKNEVLYITKIHPLNNVGRLPDTKVVELLQEIRNYAFDFLRWKKEFTLKKHWLAHTKTICSRCDIPLIKQHLGSTKRRTFFCNKCQKLYK